MQIDNILHIFLARSQIELNSNFQINTSGPVGRYVSHEKCATEIRGRSFGSNRSNSEQLDSIGWPDMNFYCMCVVIY